MLKTGKVVEVKNVAENPLESFEVQVEDLEKYETKMVATWHTHPGRPANLSSDDFVTYLNWPHLTHHVVGEDGVRTFKVVNGSVMNA